MGDPGYRRMAAHLHASDASRPAGDEPAPGDAELVARAALGDTHAIAAIWSRHHTLAKSVLLSTLGPDQDIDDLVQETFVELFRAVKLVRDGIALPAVLSRIAVRRAGMTLRRRRIRSVVFLLPWTDVPEIAVAPPDLDDRFALAAFYRLLDRVKTRHRVALLLHFVQGMDVATVASVLDISVPAAKRAIGAGRKRLIQLARREPRLSRFVSSVEGG